ncbi:aminotransferase class IV [uncultured Eudoraea sp.]|uniref:aminotransferase class IV n=1 Tax=uncultured Eudoraea sp. TaxID=1035614 RepID=UPI0026073ECD|nr:aminotransferase class IV [uncultured Eudoraea sp.]
MVNYDGQLVDKNSFYLHANNRGFLYGDALFETIRVVNGRLIFWEDHYLRLMSSMRILRMEIPMSFTMEFLEEQILKVLAEGEKNNSARIRITVFRKNGGFYLPKSNEVSYLIGTEFLADAYYILNEANYEVELFKDFTISKNMLSNLKTTNRVLNVVGSIYAKENGYDNCLLLNDSKSVVEALNGNIFLVKDKVLKTPPLEDGCIKGTIRKKVLEIINKIDTYECQENSISPFELQQADELFITNSVMGIQPITKYRKKIFENKVAKELLGKLNAAARFN